MNMGNDGDQRALITGASSGIGEAFARRLAADGCHLILVARRKDRLEAVAAELADAHSVAVRVVQADLIDPDGLSAVEAVVRETPGLDLLVNNAGMAVPKRFGDVEVDVWDRMTRLHTLATIRLTHAALPKMIERDRGAVINVSSIGGFMPVPRNVVYSSTKAFITTFTEGLHLELGDSGVRMQSLCPGWTRTEMVDDPEIDTSRVPEKMWMTPEEVVSHSLRDLERGRVISIPGWRNRLLLRIGRLMPRAMLHRHIRNKARKFEPMKDEQT
jgi:short-subunit dehydrogenase